VGAVFVAVVFVIGWFTGELNGGARAQEALQRYYTDLDWQSLITAVTPLFTPTAGLLTLALSLLRTVVSFGFSSYCLKVARGRDADMRDLGDGFALFFKVIWLNILIGFFVALWSLLFLVPGVIAALRYSQARYILMENPELSALACIRQSKAMMRGHKPGFFLLNLSFIGWWLLTGLVQAYLFLPLPDIWVAPYSELTMAFYYTRLGAPAVME
jgi:uncharacterized membrane protein